MKLKLFILSGVFLFTLISTSAQPIQALPDSDAVWIMEQYSGGPQTNWYWIYYTNSDTLINSNAYNKLYSTTAQQLLPQTHIGCYVGAYRNDTVGRVYFIPHDSIQEYRLYDFSKNVGDTINDIPVACDPCDFCASLSYVSATVDSVKYVTRGSRIFKKMFLTMSGLGSGFIWMESVGSPWSGFYPQSTLGFTGLYCMHYNDTIYYRGSYGSVYDYDYSPGYCDTLVVTGLDASPSAENEILIYPIAFSKDITIAIRAKILLNFEVNIINTLGQRSKDIILPPGSMHTINLSDLKNGIYLMILKINNRTIKIQKIIKL